MDIVEQAVQLKAEMETMRSKKRRFAEEAEALEERLCRASNDMAAAAELKEQLDDMESRKRRLTEETREVEENLGAAHSKLAIVQVDMEKLKRTLPAAGGDEVLTLDVGGRQFKAYRSTLDQFPDSVLATMVSSRWSEGARQECGALFFDMDPVAFDEILKYLRERRIISSVSPNFSRHAHNLAAYLGIVEPAVFRFGAVSTGPQSKDYPRVVISEGGAMCEIQNTSATRSGGSSSILVVGMSKQPITRIGAERSIFSWCFECAHVWSDGTPLLLGLVDASFTGTVGGSSHAEKEMIGIEAWTGHLRCLAAKYEHRVDSLSEGDTVSFCVDMQAGIVTASVNGRSAMHLMNGPEVLSREWRPAVFTRGRPASGNVRVRIVSA